MKDNSRTQAARSAATRDALLRAARPLFAGDGFAAVSTEAIVRAAGVTRGALYHQFADKAELFAAVFETVEAEVTQRIDDVVSGSTETDPVALMRLGASAWLDASTEPGVARIVLLEAPVVLGWERWREVGLRYGMGLVQGLLEWAISVDALRRQPVEPLAHVLIGALDEAALYIARATDPAQARVAVGAVVDDLIRALAVETSPAAPPPPPPPSGS